MYISSTQAQPDQLKRISYNSEINGEQRDFFLYLPNGYEDKKDWPVIMFLHGNGERGNGKEDLDNVKFHGPLYEAWVQKRKLPFIILVPQLHLFDVQLANRDSLVIPERLKDGVPGRIPEAKAEGEMSGTLPEMPDTLTLPHGWDKVENDLSGILNHVFENYKADSNRVYLTGISYGGFGTWHFASTHPGFFAAIAPIVGWGHPDLMPPIAENKIPVWAFAAGRDRIIEAKYFYSGINRLEELGHTNVRFTIHEDMNHDAWKRIYAGEDLYSWLLSHKKQK